MTGPAILIMLLSQVLQMLNQTTQFDWLEFFVHVAAWIFSVILLTLAARPLRGKGDFTRTLRVAGFAQSAHVLELLGFIPVVAPLSRLLAVLLSVIGLWLGTAIAHELKGWRTILLPVIYILTTIVAVVFSMAALQGFSITFDAMIRAFGLAY